MSTLAGFAQPAAAPRFSRNKEAVRGAGGGAASTPTKSWSERGFSAKEIGELKAAGVVGPQA